jgi:hypothetical protein
MVVPADRGLGPRGDGASGQHHVWMIAMAAWTLTFALGGPHCEPDMAGA